METIGRFYTSDLHFDHYNIMRYCDRPFDSVEEMNETMIDNWNSMVKSPNDIVVVLGDFCWGDPKKFIPRLNGYKILVKGNHDRRDDYHKYFNEVCHYKEMKINGNSIVCSHFAMRVWNRSHFGSLHCYGHSHGTLPGVGRSMDVGVDTNNFYPYSEEEVITLLNNKEIIAFNNKEL